MHCAQISPSFYDLSVCQQTVPAKFGLGAIVSVEMAATGTALAGVIGSRKSDLAMWQAREVQSLLSSRYGGATTAFPIQTEAALGDNVLDQSLATLAAANPGVFTKELEVGLLGGAYTIAVHSLKDMPTNLPPGLALVGISAREDPRDAVVLAMRHTKEGGGTYSTLADLPAGSVIGTSSVRREALLHSLYPALTITGVRGNLNTRLRKLDTPPQQDTAVSRGEAQAPGASIAPGAPLCAPDSSQPAVPTHYDALVLAAAGMARMGWTHRISQRLDPSEFPYGVSQGALGIEARAGDAVGSELGRAISHGPTALRCLAERAFLRKLQGGCQVPVGINSWYEDGEGKDGLEGNGSTSAALKEVQGGQPELSRVLSLHGSVLSLDGSTNITASISEPVLVPQPEHAAQGSSGKAHAGLEAACVPTVGPIMSQAQWNRLVADGNRIGYALADKVLQAGAAGLLEPLQIGKARPLTYGAAEGAEVSGRPTA